MAVPLEQFVKHVEDSGILAGDTLKEFLPPKSEPKDAEELARELVRQKKLTKFQAEELWKGKGNSLVFGNYVLMEKIGAGGMGQVFKAQHRVMERLVAVKVLPTAMTKNKDAIARFHREVKAAAKLRHLNIIAADDADQANGVHFLVMELVDGSDLSALVKKNGPFPVNKAVNYILQAARGLEYAHGEGVVHRDIKPANLLLDKKGTVKILDMGLARIHGDVGQAELTASGAVMGTVDYMAPEQAMSTKTADARADIYSLGCSLYYLLTGKATYDGETLMAKLVAHRDHPIPDLRAVCPQVPDQVEAIFKKMVAKKIEDRYQTMTAVIADLERCESDTGLTHFLKEMDVTQNAPKSVVQKTSAVRTPKRYRRDIFQDKRTLLIGGAVLGVLILFAGVILSFKTKDGKLVVTVNEPDAEVQVLSEEGKVEITRKGEKGPITISVDPGKHRLKVQKDGFELFTKEFEIKKGGEKSITAKLVPVDDKPAVAGTKSAVAGLKESLFFQTPGFEPWMKDVQAMPAEKQLEAVSKKLMELNEGFDGKLGELSSIANVTGTPRIENGVVTELLFITTKVTDISPLRVLSGLKVLHCAADYNGILTDVSPLQGMRLKQLKLFGNRRLTDLSPLKDMPLAWMDIQATSVSDLMPLRGMPLAYLNLHSCDAVVDLSPLKGLPLTFLATTSKSITDLSPLQGMKLKVFQCGSPLITDFKPLQGMPLDRLAIGLTKIDDLSILKGMPLVDLDLFGCTNISDFSPLKEFPLKHVRFEFKTGRDTEILRSIKTLETINDKPVAAFWKEVEEQQKGKKQ